MNDIRYGYMTPENDGVKVRMQRGQNIAGYSIGIIYIDEVYYPMLPGNVVNGCTYDYPVRLKAVKGLDIQRLFAAGDEVLEPIIAACEELKREGVRAISAACGFFGNYQRQAAEALDLPVALSSLVQLPWIAALLKGEQKIGVLTADRSSLSSALLASCGVSGELKRRLVIKDLRHEPEFSCILEGRGVFDNAAVRREVVKKAVELVEEYPETGAILLECSDMPPYAAYVQEATGRPVFDFITLINWLHQSVCQKPYNGFI